MTAKTDVRFEPEHVALIRRLARLSASNAKPSGSPGWLLASLPVGLAGALTWPWAALVTWRWFVEPWLAAPPYAALVGARLVLMALTARRDRDGDGPVDYEDAFAKVLAHSLFAPAVYVGAAWVVRVAVGWLS